jgi:PAS domain S-box-containing protein
MAAGKRPALNIVRVAGCNDALRCAGTADAALDVDVDASLESPADEAARLRSCLNDLVSIMSLSARLAGGQPPDALGTLMDTVIGMLRLAFVVVRLNHHEDGRPIEVVRVAESWAGAARTREISDAIDSALGDAPRNWPSRAQVAIGDVVLSVASTPLGLEGDLGAVAAGSQSLDFPMETERLVLDVAANQAAIALQQSRLLNEQTRRANESERESRLIVDNIPGLVALLSSTGDVEIVNRQLLEYFGQTLEELRQWGTNGTVHPEDLPHVADVFTRSIASGTPFEIVQRLRRADGVYRWNQNSGFPLRDTKGQILRWCVLLTDIDDRQRAEEALLKRERELQLLVETIPALVWRGTPEGELDYLNERAVEYLGHTAESLSGGRWINLIHPDHRDAAARRWLHSATTGCSYDDIYKLRRADGEYRWIQSVGEPFYEIEGRIAHWYGLVIDIDDLKRAESELRRAYDSFAEAQRLSKTGSFITDLVGDDHNWSDEAYRIFGFDRSTKVSVQRVRDVIHPDDLPAFESVIARGMTGVDVNFAFRIVTATGSAKHVRGVAHVVEQLAGRPMFVGALQDVTETKVAEEALNRAGAELAHVSRITTLSALTASIAHEVSQPLSGIITNAGTCLRMLDAAPPDIDGARETARRTIRDGNRASDVIKRLRALFSKREFTLEPLDLNEAAREVIALTLSDLQRNCIVLSSELAENLPVVSGDRVQLQQVILNLLRNASDAMVDVHDRPRHLRITTVREDGHGVRVIVRDAGVGLPPQGANSIFEAFHTTKSGGMGIGLFVSRSIIERHHGRLWAEPNDGAPGATFSFTIPCVPEGAPSTDSKV